MEIQEWWDRYDDSRKRILIFLALLPQAVSLDTLIAASSLKAVEILKFIEELKAMEVVGDDAELGKGFYCFANEWMGNTIRSQASREDLEAGAEALLSFYKEGIENEQETALILAHLYKITGIIPPGLDSFLEAAIQCASRDLHEEAVSYYRIILENKVHSVETLEDKNIYVNAAIGITAYSHMLSLSEQSAFLEQARKYACEIDDRERLLTVRLALGKTLEVGGFYEEAAQHLDEAWRLAQKLGNEQLLKKAALMTSDFLFRQGRVAEAVLRYEEVIGDLEDFSSDEATLRGCATLGWCYGVCGQTSRGVGLIEAVRIQAEEHHMKKIEAFAYLMMVFTLLEARRISEAETYLDAILRLPPGALGHSIPWATHWCMAYVAYCHGDLEECRKEHTHGCELLKKYGRPHHRGGWVLEYLEALEAAEMEYTGMTLKSELERLIHWPDIFMKGVAYRFRGQKAQKDSGGKRSGSEDFEMSLALLTRSGARLELARTQIALARVLFTEGKQGRARKLLAEAWDAMSHSNASLFPQDLKLYIEEISHEDLLVNTIVEIANVLGTVREKKKLLELVIQLTMRFTFAERGGFFLVGENGDLELGASRNLDVAMVRSDRFRPYLKEIEQVARTGKETIQQIKGFQTSEGPETSRTNWLIGSPVTLQNRLLGVLYLAAKVTPDHLKNDLRLLRAISTQVAVALDNVRAYERIASLKDRLEEETRYYRMDSEISPQLEHMVGGSDAIRMVQTQMQKVAPMDSTVLVTGETGVGKELVARGIHRLSRRFSGPFIAVNVASLSEGVIESELFGHEKGAFTGAIRARMGRFELAQGGTLFLDDIQNLSWDIQAKFLRVLEEKEFDRVGGSHRFKANFRLIAATNRPLEEMVEERLFRADLFYRLNVFPICVPPLRERQEDIPALAIHFLETYNNNLGKSIQGISKRNMKRLQDYPWPGNVRELHHIIERAVILSERNTLVLPSFQTHGREESDSAKDVSMEEMERSYIVKILEKCSWKVGGEGGAAQSLGLKPTTLHSKMKKLGIRRKITVYNNLNP